jgi:2-polyprenyl-6-methoxyphenol hydroxylase-like FAD-dependent oxidoreductase
MAFGDEKTLLYGTKGDDSIMFIASFKVPENWVTQNGIDFNNKEQVLDWFKSTYADWSGEWHEFLTSNELNFILRPQYHFPLNQSWKTLDNLTMIGDAAHRMPPFAGEGANVAMQDAFELAACLTGNKFPNILTAISSFEKQMVTRGAMATQETLVNTEIMHSKTAMEQMLDFFSLKPSE